MYYGEKGTANKTRALRAHTLCAPYDADDLYQHVPAVMRMNRKDMHNAYYAYLRPVNDDF